MFRKSSVLQKQVLRASQAVSRTVFGAAPAQRSYWSHALSSSAHTVLRPSPISQIRSSRRWQSTEAETKDDKTAQNEEKPAESAKDAQKAELEKKNKEIIELKDKYLRSVADYRNLQDRMKREQDSARQFAIQRFATDLLDSIDNLDRALISVPDAAVGKSSASTTSNTSSADPNKGAATESAQPNADLLNLYSGLKMTNEIMLNTLKKHGLERFDPLEREGRKFNPSTDEATFFTKVEGKEDGEVFYTQSKGFTLNGRVVRAAKVGVVKNS